MKNIKDYKVAASPEEFLLCFEQGTSFDNILINNFAPTKLFEYATNDTKVSSKLLLAYCFENGVGTSKDLNKAFSIYNELGSKNEPYSCAVLSDYYYFGINVEKDELKAFTYCKIAADKGIVESMNRIAIMYQNGEGTNKDLQKSFEYFIKAADAGHINAMYNVGYSYIYGFGVKPNIIEGITYLKLAANNGVAEANHLLGAIYEEGNSVIFPDCYESFKWYLKAAKLGDINSSYKVADSYRYGVGCNINLEEMFKYYLYAANAGLIEAMEKISDCYYFGIGCKKDINKANYWNNKIGEQRINSLSNK